MKKVLSVILTLVLALPCAINVFASSRNTGNFIESPGGKSGPQLIDYTNASSDCTAKVIITPYRDRDTLPQELKDMIEEAYRQIIHANRLTDLTSAIAAPAALLNVGTDDLYVSDLFDVRYYGCDEKSHKHHSGFTITVKADMLDRFVCLLHYYNAAWTVVDSAKTNADKTELTFFVDSLSPFAIVVNAKKGSSDPGKTNEPTSPQTDDPDQFLLIGGVSLAVCSVVCILFSKKRRSLKK